jgi:hypothetical protein
VRLGVFLFGAKSRKRAKGRARGQYLVLRGEGGALPGVYVRKSARAIMPFMMFVRSPSYRSRFPFYERVRIITQANYARRFAEGWAKYVASRLTRLY